MEVVWRWHGCGMEVIWRWYGTGMEVIWRWYGGGSGFGEIDVWAAGFSQQSCSLCVPVLYCRPDLI